MFLCLAATSPPRQKSYLSALILHSHFSVLHTLVLDKCLLNEEKVKWGKNNHLLIKEL